LSLGLRKEGLWMFAATFISGGLSYLANAAVGRLLGPTNYSVYTAMVSLILMLGAVTAVIQTVTTNYVARLRADEQMPDVGALLVYLLRQLLLWGLAAVVIVWALGRPLAALLHLPSTVPVWVVATALAPIAVLPVLQGGLRGLERFVPYGINMITLATLRLGTGIGLIVAGWDAVGAIASLPLAYLGTAVLALFWLAGTLRLRNHSFQPNLSSILGYASYTAASLFSFTALTNMDILFVKLGFAPDQAGLYSAIATIGKITLYLPFAATVLLLPRVAILNARRERTVQLLYRALLIMGLLCSMITLAFFLFPSLLVELMFGAEYLAWASLLGPYGLAMTLYSLCNLWLAYYLALEDKRYSSALLVGTVLQAVLFLTVTLSLRDMVTVLIVIGLALNAVGFWFLRRPVIAQRRGETSCANHSPS
jgi:O-antigen/teichoic acid export membrane protein